jgi:hypothetical protein
VNSCCALASPSGFSRRCRHAYAGRIFSRPQGERFFLEAAAVVTSLHVTTLERIGENALYDEVNRLDSPNFFMDVREQHSDTVQYSYTASSLQTPWTT